MQRLCAATTKYWSAYIGAVVVTRGIPIQHGTKIYHSNNMQPFLTLHHFVEPAWFEDMGGFERSVNIQHFVDFASFASRCGCMVDRGRRC